MSTVDAQRADAASPGPAPGLPRVGFIVGPTGVGKSAFAVEIAERLGGEIVNADSRQLYRGMDIGTAKPGPKERHRVPHHLVDVRTPDDPIDVAKFAALAHEAIAGIVARGCPVLAVGGSGLYLRALRDGIFGGPGAAPEIRRELAALANNRGAGYLHGLLREVDPVSAARVGPNDLYRLVRALEVYRLTGTPISVHQRCHGFAGRRYDCVTVGLTMPREKLYEAINRRFDRMAASGIVDEVRALLAEGYRPDKPPLCTIGYRQMVAFVRGELEFAEAVDLAKRDTRRLAKRQLTWFRADPEIVWVDATLGIEQAFGLFQRFFFEHSDAARR